MNESSNYSNHTSYDDSEIKKDLQVNELYANGTIGLNAAKMLYTMEVSRGDE